MHYVLWEYEPIETHGDHLMPSQLFRPTPTKSFLHEHTDLRIAEAAIDAIIEILTDAAERIAISAKELALEEARNTLMARDIQSGFETFISSEGPGLLRPATIHTAIDGITNESLADLINLLRTDVGVG